MSDHNQYPDFNALCQAVGFTVLTWAHIEQILDMSIAVVFQNCGGNEINPQIPRNLKSKLVFMRKCLRNLDVLGPFQEQGIDLMDRISNMKRRRHDVVHGVITSLAASDGVYEFRRLDTKEAMHHVKDSDFNLNKFPDFAKVLSDLGTDMVQFCQALAQEFAKPPRQSLP